MKKIGLGLVGAALVTFAQWGMAADDPETIVQTLTDRCAARGAPLKQCSCVAQGLRKKYSAEEMTRISTPGRPPQNASEASLMDRYGADMNTILAQCMFGG